ncbi:MAG: 50S ribosomal protein L29 [Gammaproteobacteria bacterium]|nr:50S ribosomal protein L29 [Gammaproteobacteria bacterium]MBU6509730.1 50S ribosomal protein L29 [Gammaproteobacteria bacterium]MDE1983543.1 50S ribosomal protein L29 [Gammaproteobacteria bacterium]MDE2107652.1 50S ribosomal protein L29 [Gammaproteobacteria bacterium]MDE2460102.1 50S ribosomal protein L29 [Gammaproteobacteria bacterium]
MDTKELRAKNEQQLKDELLALRQEQFNLAMQQASGQMPRGHQIRNARKNIARLKTVQAERAKAVKK